MKILKNWRIITLIFMVILCAILIHPFTKSAVEITEVSDPASLVLRPGDFVSKINDVNINSVEDFNDVSKDINFEDDVKIEIKRESFPYNYLEKTHGFIAKDEENPTSIYVKPNTFSKLNFNAQLQESNKFVIKTDNPENTIDVLSKRFKIARVNDYILKQDNGDVILYTSAGKELTKVIETEGVFEAKIGDKLFFTDKEIESYCVSGVNCVINTYPVLNKSLEKTEVLWKYGFETHIVKDTADGFGSLVEHLGILSCEFDRCELNDTVTFFIDDEEVGFEKIYASDKERSYSRIFIGGEAETKEDALKNLYLMQAVLKGRTDAEISSIESAPALMGDKLITTFLVIIGAIIVLNAILLFIQFKSIVTSLISIAIGAGNVMIIFGILAGLNFTIGILTMVMITIVPVLALAYQNYTIFWIKKEGIILKKIATLNSKLNKWLLITSGLTVVITMFNPALGTPLFIYSVMSLIITKSMFFRAIKAKRA